MLRLSAFMGRLAIDKGKRADEAPERDMETEPRCLMCALFAPNERLAGSTISFRGSD